MTTLRIGTWNLYEYDRHRRSGDPAELERYNLVAEVLDDMACDVIALQEVCGRGRVALEQLARDAGMSCWYDPPWTDEDGSYLGRVAITGTGTRESDFNVGLLWKTDQLRPYLDGFRSYPGGSEFWHGLATQEFRVDGLDAPLLVGSYHAAPFAQDQRPDEARRVVSAMTRPYAEDKLAIIGADWNSISADRVQAASASFRYWHADPYWSVNDENRWTEAYGYQCIVDDEDEQGIPTRWHADRRPGEVLLRAGCRDAAALAAAKFAPSVGHADHADMGERCIDTHRVSPALAPAVVDWAVIDTPSARCASDHLPVVTTLDVDQVG